MKQNTELDNKENQSEIVEPNETTSEQVNVNTDSSPKRTSLKLKFIVGIAILVGLIVLMNYFSALSKETQLLNESMDRSGKLLATTLAIACQEPIISQRYDEFVPYTERIITGDPNIQEISILDLEGI